MQARKEANGKCTAEMEDTGRRWNGGVKKGSEQTRKTGDFSALEVLRENRASEL